MTTKRPLTLIVILLVGAVLGTAACEPLVPSPTPQTIIITATPSQTPPATPTPTLTPTPDVTATPTPTASPTPPLCDETSGRVIVFDTFASETAGRNMPYRVYVPPCYFQLQRRLPVLYLLHGAGNDDTHWEDVGLVETLDRGISLGIYPPLLVVMPYGAQLLPNADFPPDPSLETYLLDELLPRIEHDFCTWEDRAYRAIGGISRGGFWALSIAMRHPDLFGAVGGHSPALDTDITPADFNPLDLALNAPFLDTLRLYLDNGANDIVRPEVAELSNHLVERQIAHEYVINPLGDHSDDYWAGHVADYLAFYTAEWEGALPSCLAPSP